MYAPQARSNVEKFMQLIKRDDLRFGRKGFGGYILSGVLMSLLGVKKVNGLYSRNLPYGDDFAAKALEDIGTSYNVLDYDLQNIPAEGAAIAISNHPTGAIDGIMLIDLLSRKRPDVKFMGNFLLDRIEPLAKYFISVDPFSDGSKSRNVAGIRECRKHLESGGMLVIFPAGEVATWRKGFSNVKDKPWSRSVMRFIKSADVPVVPICIEGRNSRLFHLAGKIHPLLRTAMLPREMMNKKGQVLDINIGAPVSPRRLVELDKLGRYSDFLRANVEYLHKKTARKRIRIIPKRKSKEVTAEDVISPMEAAALRTELNAIRGEHLLLSHGSYDVFCAPSALIPNMMMEIGRLREVTFREIGEGTNRSFDTDHYDTYYHQLFVWDNDASTLVGAYRMGMGREITDKYGLEGFYINTLFKMDDHMLPVMRKTIELGRSFIAKDYQRKPASLMLLWKGIIYVLLKNDEYRNLVGPVTISGEFDKVSKTIIVRYLQKFHYNKKLAKHITPITGLDGIDSPIDDSLIDDLDSLELMNKIIVDIERGGFAVPVLIRKYLQLNSHVLGFNVDHEFSDCLDALMLLDLKKVPESTVLMLSKEIADIDVVARFKKI